VTNSAFKSHNDTLPKRNKEIKSSYTNSRVMRHVFRRLLENHYLCFGT